MRTFELYDHVLLKNEPTLYGSVERTHTEAYEPLEDELIIAHADVPPAILNEFVVNGVPPQGYVFVQFADEAAGSSLVAEEDLVLLSRTFQLGDHVKSDNDSPMTGAVVNISDSYILEPIGTNPGLLDAWPIKYPPYSKCTTTCPSPATLPPQMSHPNPHALLYQVPAREVKRAQEVVKDDYVIADDWIGLVEEVKYDVAILLQNESVVVVDSISGLHIPVPEYGKPLVALPEYDDLRRPDALVATQGWSSTIPVQEPRPGYFVIIDRTKLRTGHYARGSYDPRCPTNGIVMDVRARQVSADWLSSMSPQQSHRSHRQPPYELAIYENIDCLGQRTVRPRRDVTIYDAGRLPIKTPKRPTSTDETPGPNGTGANQNQIYPGTPDTQDIYSGQDIRIGAQVRFRDPTAAAVKYQGTDGTTHGRWQRLAPEQFYGFDLNEFKVVCVKQESTVLWQDGTVSTIDSSLLKPYVLFEVEPAPTDIVLKRADMKQRVVRDRSHGETVVKDFDEMTSFEQPHDILPQSVGVVQTVDPTERIARVRWYKGPKIEIQASGQVLAPNSQFGPISAHVEDVSLYEIMSFPCLQRRRRDMCVIHSASRLEQEPATEGPSQARSAAQSGSSGPSRRPSRQASMAIRTGGCPGRRPLRFAADTPELRLDWVGEIIALGLDGSSTLRMGGLQPCRDIRIDADSIIALIDDRDRLEELDHSMDVDLWDYAGMSDDDDEDDDMSATISETVEYEGGHRIDNDSGEDNWESEDDGAEYADALERMDEDTEMVDVSVDDAQDNSAQSPLVHLQGLLGTEAPPQFMVIDSAPPADQFGLHSAWTSRGILKRIMKEHKILASSLPKGEIYVRTYENRLDLLRCLIVGPRDTPYENAPFLIDLYLPERFPEEPPTAHFHSWTSGLGRINPNLYEEGKICLSLLGTWSGQNETEKWTDKATILQVLVSLQGLVFVKKPFYNEAGFEGYENDQAYTREAEQYSEKAFLMARGFLKHALLRPPGGVEDLLAWLYLSPQGPDSTNLLSRVISRAQRLMEKSEELRAAQDESLLDAAGDQGDPMRVFLKPLSRGAGVMLERIINELKEQYEQL